MGIQTLKFRLLEFLASSNHMTKRFFCEIYSHLSLLSLSKYALKVEIVVLKAYKNILKAL